MNHHDWYHPIGKEDLQRRCFVGSGECNNAATHVTGDGEGGIVFVCAHHVEEMELWEEKIAAMEPAKLAAFEAAVDEAHRTGLN